MIGVTFQRIDGTQVRTDMRKLKKVATGESRVNPGWGATLVFSEEFGCYIELSGEPEDYRGNSRGIAVEVDLPYARSVYGVNV